MKLKKLISKLLLISFVTAMMVVSCEKITYITDHDQTVDEGEPVPLVRNFGIRVNEATGEVVIIHNGRAIPYTKTGSMMVSNTIVNADFTFNGVVYSPQGCGSFSTTNGANIRTVGFVFENTGSTTYPTIVPTNITGTKLFGLGGSLETNIAPGDEFTIAFDAGLETCETFTFFFDLSDNFTD